MSIQTLEFQYITFHYPEQSMDLFTDLSLSVGPGWTAVIGANGGGKSTLLKLACNRLEPLAGAVMHPGLCLYVPQRTDEIPPSYDEFAYSYDALSCKLHGQLGLQRDFLARWDQLSHGERKRAQIAWALYEKSDLLCIDEPTNHLDRDAMHVIVKALQNYRGIGLLVSHDREVLDALCTSTVHVQSPFVSKLSCPPSQAMEEMRKQRIAAETAYVEQGKQLKRLMKEKQRRSAIAGVQDSRNTKRRIDPKDHDAKARIDGFRVSGGDKVAGQLSRQLDNRVLNELSNTQSLHRMLDEKRALDLSKSSGGITLQGVKHAARVLLDTQQAVLSLGGDRKLFLPPLALSHTDRVGIRGPNGIGKSTLVRHLLPLFAEKSIRSWYLEQEMDLEQSLASYQAFELLEPQVKGRIVSTVVRLGSNAQLFLLSALPSPGELRKLLIAQALESNLSLLVLDEPTNHLDLPSRLALETELRSFAGALLLVSHDQDFLEQVCTTWWDLSYLPGSQNAELLVH